MDRRRARAAHRGNQVSNILEVLKRLEELSPMRTEYVSTEAEFVDAVAAAEKRGMRLACVSNAGLQDPQKRLTFLPAEKFTGGQSPR